MDSSNYFFDKRVWLIGASSGIGKSVAQQLAKSGAKVVVSARRTEVLSELCSASPNIEVLSLDVSTEGAIAQAVLDIEKDLGPIDMVVYLSAHYEPSAIHKLMPEDLEKTLRVNLWAAIELARCITPIFYARRAGVIAFVGSVAGYRGLPMGQPYSATKAALMNFAESLYMEARSKSVEIKLISPGFVETPMTEKNQFVMPDIISTNEAAEKILEGLQKNDFEIHFPKGFTRKLKFLRLLPYKAYFRLVGRR